jgi:methionyl-tRNA formyltransferase
MKIGILCSGNLGLNLLQQLLNKYEISFVFTDFNSKEIINYCQSSGISIFIGNPRKKNTKEFLSTKKCDILLSINYLFLIDIDLINFPDKYAINIHGSLLPKYRGRTPHIWAIINNEKKTGITAHLIDSGCDTGDIIDQIEVEICDSDTGAMILDKFQKNYFTLINQVLKKIEHNQLSLKPQDHSKATYFGKRVPEDGLIDWNWQKERIFNWIRAQAAPYPGAYTYINGCKLTIDFVSFIDDGFEYDLPNGTVLSINPLKVKTPNGVILIQSYRENLDNLVTKKIILG